MEYRWVVKNKLQQPLHVKDLGLKGLWMHVGQVVELHKHYSYEQVDNSQGLRVAFRNGWLEELEKIVPNELDVLKSQISQLTSLVQTLASNGVPQSTYVAPVPQEPQAAPVSGIEAQLLKQIAMKLDRIQGKAGAPTGFKELTPEEAALKAHERESKVVKKESNFTEIGTMSSIETNAQELADQLGTIDIPLDDEEGV